MIMVKVTEKQSCHKLGSNFSSFLPIILVLVLVLVLSIFFFFLVSESSPFLLTLLIALLSTLFLVTLTKKKVSLHENFVQDNQQKLELQLSLDVITQQSETSQSQVEAESESAFPLDSESSNISDESFELSAEKYEQKADPQADTSLPSDSESSTSSTMGEEGIEIHHIRNQNVDIYDSFPIGNDEEEEDGLIEIKLPNNHFSELLPESIFKQQGLKELLAEINEMNDDENLIEIDISKGSTKYQDLRLDKELVC
ncbi:uncharacterized protein LOC109791929 [Cajanus cajan]|uniref:Transmembrane protein n=1 Tax=Cajanus cajan TaxID=3821 RepID=A0A151U2H0_CAJCA|nr:uncharacterized protein LOC109791929 [Cajanus cajan]KYP73471.1 hypothetical protein KK1_006096 [Cajanus cajan]